MTGAVDPALTRMVCRRRDRERAAGRAPSRRRRTGRAASLDRAAAAGASSACMTRRRCAIASSPAMHPARAGANSSRGCFQLLARRQERRWFGYADRVVVTSPSDAHALSGAVSADRIAVIPNGVDLEYFAYRPAPEAGRIVFTGNMSWPPNEDAAEHFARDLMPAIRSADSRRVVLDRRRTSFRREFKTWRALPEFTSPARSTDIRPWISSAAVYASPLRFGLGVKNKILEAMASGAPIVATSRSLSGTPLVDGRHAMIADDDAKFVDAMVRLLSDPELRESLSREARRKVEAEYSWVSVAITYEGVYLRGSRHRPGTDQGSLGVDREPLKLSRAAGPGSIRDGLSSPRRLAAEARRAETRACETSCSRKL